MDGMDLAALSMETPGAKEGEGSVMLAGVPMSPDIHRPSAEQEDVIDALIDSVATDIPGEPGVSIPKLAFQPPPPPKPPVAKKWPTVQVPSQLSHGRNVSSRKAEDGNSSAADQTLAAPNDLASEHQAVTSIPLPGPPQSEPLPPITPPESTIPFLKQPSARSLLPPLLQETQTPITSFQPVPAFQPAAPQQGVGAYTLQSMLVGQPGGMQPNGGFALQQPPAQQGYQFFQPQVYSAWPPPNYYVAPTNVPQPVMHLVMPQMQTTDQQQYGGSLAYHDFHSLLSPSSASQPSQNSGPLPSPNLEPPNPPPPPPFLVRQDSGKVQAQTNISTGSQPERASDQPALSRGNLSRFGDTYNYADLVQGGTTAPPPYDTAGPLSEEQHALPLPSRERSTTAESVTFQEKGQESPRTRAASMDRIKGSRSFLSRAGTSFSVPVREVFTVVNEDEVMNQQDETSVNGDTVPADLAEGGFEDNISPRRQAFLGGDGLNSSPGNGKGQDVAQEQEGPAVMLNRSRSSSLMRSPNEEQLLEAIKRSRERKSFIEKSYGNLEPSLNPEEESEEDEEEENRQETLPAIITKKTMSPSYGENTTGQRMTRAEKKKKAVEATLAKVLQRIEVFEEEKEAQLSEQQKHSWWSRMRERRQLKKRSKQRFEGTDLWDEQLKLIEGRFGSSISMTFAFLRFVFYVNVLTSLCWFLLIILPFLISPPPSFKWTIFTSASITGLLQGNGLDNTFFFYGGYNYKYATASQASDQKGWYRTDYAYPLAILMMFLIGLLAIMRKIAQRLAGEGDSSIVQGNKYFPFSTLVFGSWDFHITNVDAAQKLRRGIRMQLREMLSDARAAQSEDVINKGSTRVLLVMQRLFVLGILWPLLVVGTAAVVVIAITQGDYLNRHLGSDFGQSIVLALINTVGPSAVRFLVTLQFWRPATAERVETTKIYVVRMINAGTLFYRLYYIFRSAAKVSRGTSYGSVDGEVTSIMTQTCDASNNYKCDDGYECCTAGADYCESDPNTVGSQVGQCVTACVENVIGRLLLRFLLVNSLISNASELGFSLVMLLFTQNKRQILVPDMAIDIIYIQSLVWISAIYCPMAPLFGACLNAFTFFWMKNVALSTCAPPEKTYSASRTSNLTYGLLLVTLLLCSVPATISFLQSHQECGPHEFSSMQDRVSYYINKAPAALHLAFQYLGNPAILGGVIALLVFALVLVRAKETKYQTSMAMTQKELSNYRKETHQKISDIRLQSMGLSPTPLSVSGRSSPAHPLMSKSMMLPRSRDRSPSLRSPTSRSPTSPQSPQPDSARSVLSTSSYTSQTALLTTRLRR